MRGGGYGCWAPTAAPLSACSGSVRGAGGVCGLCCLVGAFRNTPDRLIARIAARQHGVVTLAQFVGVDCRGGRSTSAWPAGGCFASIAGSTQSATRPAPIPAAGRPRRSLCAQRGSLAPKRCRALGPAPAGRATLSHGPQHVVASASARGERTPVAHTRPARTTSRHGIPVTMPARTLDRPRPHRHPGRGPPGHPPGRDQGAAAGPGPRPAEDPQRPRGRLLRDLPALRPPAARVEPAGRPIHGRLPLARGAADRRDRRLRLPPRPSGVSRRPRPGRRARAARLPGDPIRRHADRGGPGGHRGSGRILPRSGQRPPP